MNLFITKRPGNFNFFFKTVMNHRIKVHLGPKIKYDNIFSITSSVNFYNRDRKSRVWLYLKLSFDKPFLHAEDTWVFRDTTQTKVVTDI